jgi:hypothetical protein
MDIITCKLKDLELGNSGIQVTVLDARMPTVAAESTHHLTLRADRVINLALGYNYTLRASNSISFQPLVGVNGDRVLNPPLTKISSCLVIFNEVNCGLKYQLPLVQFAIAYYRH